MYAHATTVNTTLPPNALPGHQKPSAYVCKTCKRPTFSWDTFPAFIHISIEDTVAFSAATLETLVKFPIVTIEKCKHTAMHCTIAPLHHCTIAHVHFIQRIVTPLYLLHGILQHWTNPQISRLIYADVVIMGVFVLCLFYDDLATLQHPLEDVTPCTYY